MTYFTLPFVLFVFLCSSVLSLQAQAQFIEEEAVSYAEAFLKEVPEIQSFELRREGVVLSLSWETKLERDLDYFYCYRSIDAGPYELIATLPNKGQASQYFFIDHGNQPDGARLRYRLYFGTILLGTKIFHWEQS